MRKKNPTPYFYESAIPEEILMASPMRQKTRTRWTALREAFSQPQIFDLSEGSFNDLRFAFDQIMSKYLKLDVEMVPLVIQSHTKGYVGNYDTIRRFYDYMLSTYGQHIQFSSFPEFSRLLPDIQIVSKSNESSDSVG